MNIRLIAALIAAFFMFPLFSLTAFAVELDETSMPEDITEIETVIEEVSDVEWHTDDEVGGYSDSPVTDYPKTPPLPLPPSGTATVIDQASDIDGRLFYTIMTPDEHVFYLVIDKQRNSENVYFLNAVTVADLLPLAQMPLPPSGGTVTPTPNTGGAEQPGETPDTPDDESEQGGGMGTYIFIIVIAVLGGGAGWYFKIYKPKQQGAADGEEYDPAMDDAENDYADDWGEDEQDGFDDDPSWDEDRESGGEE